MYNIERPEGQILSNNRNKGVHISIIYNNILKPLKTTVIKNKKT